MPQSLRSVPVLAFVVLMLLGCAPQQVRPSPQAQALMVRAEAGDRNAQYELGSAYDTGNGVARNAQEAERWYRAAADGGHAEAQNSLGSGYQAKKRYREASVWYEKAAQQNHARAIHNLAYLHDLGLGVPQDRQKGLEMYLRAADMGFAESMFNIGQAYGAGQVGEVDLTKACMWTIRALKYAKFERVRQPAASTVDYCKNTLSANDYAQAENAANAWTPGSTKS